MKIKLNAIEILVIVAILITLSAFTYKFLFHNEKYVFSGDEMYKCVWMCNKILGQGFPLNATVIGIWTKSKEKFNGTVEIYSARGGTLYAIYNNSPITIGGRLAYKEDVAAEKIILKPIGKKIDIYELEPIEGKDLREVINKIENSINESNILAVKISGTIGINSKTYKPADQIELLNKVYIESLKGMRIQFLDNGLIVSGTYYLKGLKELSKYVNASKVVTNRLKIYVITN
ncbi:TrmB family transcriptional regulator sugar-binding domain-containing protein [Methanocaldococcus infernus]